MEKNLRVADRLQDDADKTEQRILELIEATDDSRDKGFLLILLKINTSLADNTRVVHDVANRLENHMAIFEKRSTEEANQRNQNQGAKRVWTYVTGALQAIVFGMVAYYQSQLVGLHQDVKVLQMNQAKTEITIQEHTKNHSAYDSANK